MNNALFFLAGMNTALAIIRTMEKDWGWAMVGLVTAIYCVSVAVLLP